MPTPTRLPREIASARHASVKLSEEAMTPTRSKMSGSTLTQVTTSLGPRGGGLGFNECFAYQKL